MLQVFHFIYFPATGLNTIRLMISPTMTTPAKTSSGCHAWPSEPPLLMIVL
jgi:hypothetical protein